MSRMNCLSPNICPFLHLAQLLLCMTTVVRNESLMGTARFLFFAHKGVETTSRDLRWLTHGALFEPSAHGTHIG